MGWYSARIIFEANVEGPTVDNPLRESSIRVFVAASEEAAWIRAEAIGRAAEHQYVNGDGERVTWRYLQVAEVQDLGEEQLTDGMEVFSRLYRRDTDSTSSESDDTEE